MKELMDAPQVAKGKHHADPVASWLKDVVKSYDRLVFSKGDNMALVDKDAPGSYHFTVRVAEGRAFLVGIDTPRGTGKVPLAWAGELNAEGLTRFLDRLAKELSEEQSFWD